MAMHKRLEKELSTLRGKSLLNDGLALETGSNGVMVRGATASGATSGPGRGKAGDGSTVNFVALLAGPRDSPYQGGVFRLSVAVPAKYPLEPPKMKFETRLYHPNVGNGHTPGAICLDILRKDAWSPALTIERTLVSIASLLADPNPASPMDGDAAKLYTSDRGAYNRRVREWVTRFAKGGRAACSSGDDSGAWVGDLGKAETNADSTSPPAPALGDGAAAEAEGVSSTAEPATAEIEGASSTAEPAAAGAVAASAVAVAAVAVADSTATVPAGRPSLLEELSSIVIDLSEDEDDGGPSDERAKRPRLD